MIKDCIRVLLNSSCATITGQGVLLNNEALAMYSLFTSALTFMNSHVFNNDAVLGAEDLGSRQAPGSRYSGSGCWDEDLGFRGLGCWGEGCGSRTVDSGSRDRGDGQSIGQVYPCWRGSWRSGAIIKIHMSYSLNS